MLSGKCTFIPILITGSNNLRENVKYLEKCFKQLPNNLQNLVLDLSWNEIGKNIDSLKYIVDCVDFLPNNTQNLELKLCRNDLVDSTDNANHLVEILKKLPSNLRYFKLDLNGNALGRNIQIMKYLVNNMKELPNLKDLVFHLVNEYFNDKFVQDDDYSDAMAKLKKLEITNQP